MKTITKKIKLALVLCLGLTITALNAQTTHIVNNNAGTAVDFTDLQAAIDAAANGDIIHVQQSSTSYGNVTLNKELTIIGRSHSDASYSSSIGTLELVEGCSNSVIKGLEIQSISDPFNPAGTFPLIEDVVIQDNKISDMQNFGVYRTFNNILMQGNIIGSFSTGANTSNFLITNNIFTSSFLSFGMVDTLLFSNNIISSSIGISISNNTPDLLNISNSMFISDRFNDVSVSFSSSTGTFLITNCLTYNYDANYNFATGSNITISNSQENIDPLFTFRDGSPGSIGTAQQFNPVLDDLMLQAGSPFINDGIYEAYNFKPLGTPAGLPSLKIDSYDPTVPKNSDLTVTITAKTN
ncbi:MAG: hypothetical protein Tsb0033_14850 [Winogradskyella sp.]